MFRSIIGPDRWPELNDYEYVPYTRAIASEIFRFRPMTPVAVPHVSTKELHYNGYRIPKDSVIFLNAYGIYHNRELYDNPEIFNPERFIKSELGMKPGANTKAHRKNFVFGAGRRICPGESFARQSIALNTMNLLWAFNFKKKHF